MGLPAKRLRKAHDSDNEFDYYDDELNSEHEEEKEDDDDDDDDSVEVESEAEDDSDGRGNADVDDDDEEEEDQSEDEEEEEEEEEENSNGRNTLNDDAEMHELEKEYMNLCNQERDILQNLKHHKGEDILKGQAVKNQKALWDKTLELRFLLQKLFSSSNRLPQEPMRSSFCDSDETVHVAYSDLITSSQKTLDSLLGLQEALLEKNPSILQATYGKPGQSSKHSKSSKSSDVKNDEDWSRISQLHGRITPFRNKSVDKWQKKTQVMTGAAAIKGKLHAFNQNISEQVAAYMRDPSRMIKQMQLRRSTVCVFGTVPNGEANPEREEALSDGGAQADGDPELLDDSEFYQQLLKEFFESIDPTSNETALYAVRRFQTKKRKIVDRRASKGRKIRYHVHEKIVNFKTPLPACIPPMAPKLFENLFGFKTQKPASAE
ncbi:Protein AATF [Morus notabilis]|uniref:Protein AATF n=1 Tax=Morus notabilis TaxID=981085 RepID=W9SMH5_9ROSA|nr:putative uncharacterized protein DDB_G0270496 [Morus notabilis]EXC35121.1 Protein AATF [Morus notabilis]